MKRNGEKCRKKERQRAITTPTLNEINEEEEEEKMLRMTKEKRNRMNDIVKKTANTHTISNRWKKNTIDIRQTHKRNPAWPQFNRARDNEDDNDGDGDSEKYRITLNNIRSFAC